MGNGVPAMSVSVPEVSKVAAEIVPGPVPAAFVVYTPVPKLMSWVAAIEVGALRPPIVSGLPATGVRAPVLGSEVYADTLLEPRLAT